MGDSFLSIFQDNQFENHLEDKPVTVRALPEGLALYVGITFHGLGP